MQAELLAAFPAAAAELPGVRSVIHVSLDRISDSCGFGVPRMTYSSDRDELLDWATRKGPDGLAAYHADRNAASIDGLPGWAFGGGAAASEGAAAAEAGG